MKTYKNQGLGIAFEYPSEWVSVDNCKVRYGIDVLMTNGFMNFGIMRISDEIKNGLKKREKTIKEILRATIQINEILYQDVQFNKYVVRDAYTATIMVSKKSKTTSCIVIVEKTLIVSSVDDNQMFLVVLEDTPGNYESGKNLSQLKQLFDSFKFWC